MDWFVELMQNIEKLILILTNIIMAAFGVWSQIRASRWKQTAKFIKKDGSFLAASCVPPKSIETYVDKIRKD